MKTKRFVRQVAVFIPFGLALYVVLLFAWGRLMPQRLKPNLNYRKASYGHMYSRLSDVKKASDIDVLFLGSSHTYRGFDTRIFKENGITSFNLGSSAQTPVQTKVLLTRYLPRLRPKLIVYEVYPGNFSSDGVESALDVIANDENDLHSVLMALQLNHIKVYNTLVYGLLEDLLNPHAHVEEPVIRGDDHYVEGGYVAKELTFFKKIEHPANAWKLKDKQFESFASILSMIQERNIPYVLVYSPITTSLYRSYTNGATYDSIMHQFGRYYNFNEKLPLDDSLHFYDAHHLNQQGVQMYNQYLIDFLQQQYKGLASLP